MSFSGQLLSPHDQHALGKSARARVPRSSHGPWEPHPNRADPVEILQQQADSRVAELVPIRYGRMLVSPFAFYRGAAAIMAADLAHTPTCGLHTQLCGDAHLSNFGVFGSPERQLLFDVNDFDETFPGPWEWDLKRLAASIVVAGRENGHRRKQLTTMVLETARTYREAMRTFATMTNLDVWYALMTAAEIDANLRSSREAPHLAHRFEHIVARARTRDSMQELDKLVQLVDGEPRIKSDPPIIVAIEDLEHQLDRATVEQFVIAMLNSYDGISSSHRRILEQYRFVHMARKVVGVGSVGTRVWIILLLGSDANDPLFLQVKEAQPSVLEPFVGAPPVENQGQRVVEGQWLMQAASDIFLGWRRVDAFDGQQHDFYVRQLRDWKGSVDVSVATPQGLSAYAQACAWTLARAHARAGQRRAMATYLGSGDTFDQALARFANSYADQNERDYQALVEAVAKGRITAETGV